MRFQAAMLCNIAPFCVLSLFFDFYVSLSLSARLFTCSRVALRTRLGRQPTWQNPVGKIRETDLELGNPNTGGENLGGKIRGGAAVEA